MLADGRPARHPRGRLADRPPTATALATTAPPATGSQAETTACSSAVRSTGAATVGSAGPRPARVAEVTPGGGGHGGEDRVGAVHRRRRHLARSSRRCAGVSTARRMPKDRMVRSSGSPCSSTAMPSERTQPSAMWAAPMQYERRTTSSSGRPQRTRTATEPSAPIVALAVAPFGSQDRRRQAGARPGGRRPRPSPRPRSAVEVGGPATSTSSHLAARARPMRWPRRCPACEPPAARPCRRRARPRRSVAASGQAARRPRGWPAPAPAARAGRPGGGPPPAAGWHACPRRRRRWRAALAGSPPGLAPRARRARGSRAPPTWCAACGPSRPGGSSIGHVRRHRGAAALHLARRRSRLGERLADDPRTVGRPHGHEGVRQERCRRRSRPGRGDVGPDTLRGAPSSVARCGRGGQVAGSEDVTGAHRRPTSVVGLLDRLPAGAPAEVGEQGLVAPRPGVRPAARALAASAASRTTMPGVQNPHWLRAGGAERLAPTRPRRRVEALDRRDRPAGHPAGRRHAGHPRGAVDQHRAAAALALGAAAVLDRAHAEPVAQHVQQGGAVVRHLDPSPVHSQGDAGVHEPDDRFARGDLPTHVPRRRRRPARGRACGSERKGASGAGTMSSGPANTSSGATGETVLVALLPGRHPSRGPGAAAAVRPRQLQRRGDHRRPDQLTFRITDDAGNGGRADGRRPPATPKACPARTGRCSSDRHARHLHAEVTVDGSTRHLDLLGRRPGEGAHPQARRQDGAGRHADDGRRQGRHADLHAHARLPAARRDPDRARWPRAGRSPCSSARRRTARRASAGPCSTCCWRSATRFPSMHFLHADDLRRPRARAEQRLHHGTGGRPGRRDARGEGLQPAVRAGAVPRQARRHDRHTPRRHLRHRELKAALDRPRQLRQRPGFS